MFGQKEIDEVLKIDSSLVSEYFGIEDEAYWEDGKNVLVKAKSLLTVALKYNLSEEEVKKKISEATHKLFLKEANASDPVWMIKS